MTPIESKDFHNSQRGWFAGSLYNEMISNQDIIVLTGDLGYGQFDKIRSDFPDRFINTGAAEQSLLDIACGIALEGKIPVVYTITPFLLRGFETIRTYIDHEKIPVHIVGGGRDKDYGHDGFSHDASDITAFLDPLKNIQQYFPQEKEEIPAMMKEILASNKPTFISVKR